MSTARTIPLQQFHTSAGQVAADTDFRLWMQSALKGYEHTRAGTQQAYHDWSAARDAAAAIKWHALENLDQHLLTLTEKLEARGAQVHWARDAAEARQIILQIVRDNEAGNIVKSKTMTSEEIHLNDALEEAGCRVTESDLGELIVQLRREQPYHFVFPAMHLRIKQIDDLFHQQYDAAHSDDPQALTMTARQQVRQRYLQADVGISGANFAVAETGTIAITENEGNARLTTGLPPVHIALMGIEKVVGRLEDLALLHPMLATGGTGQHMTAYNSLFSGPRQPGEPDGPEQFHLVLLDNGRTRLLADPEQRDALRCIRCGACLNVCPIFKNIGGHSYGSTYQGPIGAVITPHYDGAEQFKHLADASSLCGACTQTCPVRIDLHHHLLRHRRNAAARKPDVMQRFLFRRFARLMQRPRAYRLLSKLARPIDALTRPMHGTRLDPLAAWRRTRTLPRPAAQSFTAYWQQRRSNGANP